MVDLVPDLGTTEWAQLVGTTAAAIAALAASRSAWLNNRTARATTRPELTGQPLEFLGREVHVDVLNAGQGVASGCSFVILTQDHRHFVAGHLGTGTLKAGEGRTIRTTLPLIGPLTIGVLVARDIEGNCWAWNFGGQPKKRLYRGGKSRLMSEDDMLHAFYPRLSIHDMTRHYCVAETETDKRRERSFSNGPRPPGVAPPRRPDDDPEALTPAKAQVQRSEED
jgi:hypothetical protein